MADNVTLSIRIDPQVAADLKVMATGYGLSVNNYIKVVLMGHVRVNEKKKEEAPFSC